MFYTLHVWSVFHPQCVFFFALHLFCCYRHCSYSLTIHCTFKAIVFVYVPDNICVEKPIYLARLVCDSSSTCFFFLRYICLAATCNVVNHPLFTVRLTLLFLFMYRITIVLKTELPETGPIIPHHSSLISKPCVLTLLARVYHLLNG